VVELSHVVLNIGAYKQLGPFDENTNVAMSAISAIAVLARLQPFHNDQGQWQN